MYSSPFIHRTTGDAPLPPLKVSKCQRVDENPAGSVLSTEARPINDS